MRFLDPRIMEALGGATPGAEDAGAPVSKSRFDLVREYLEATRQAEESPSIPEADIEAARRRDLSETLTRGFSKAGRAFLGDRSALEEPVSVSTAEDKARAANAERAQRLADWAQSRGSRRLTEAGLLERLAGAESREDYNLSETERRRQRDATEAQRKADEAAAKAQAEKDRAEERRLRAAEAASARAQREAEKRAEAEAKAADKAAAARERATEGLPYGYRLREGANPSKKQREDAATAVEQRDAIMPIVDQLEALVAQGPARLADLATRKEIEQRVEQIGAAIRTIENLGVPSGPDVKIQMRLVGDPNSPVSEISGALPKMLKNLRSYFGNKTDTRLRTFGIEKDEAPQPAPASAPDTPPIPPAGKVQMLDVESGEAVFLSPQNAEALLKKGKVRKP